AEERAAGEDPGIARLGLAMERRAERGRAAALQVPERGREDRDRDAEDAPELEAREEEHPLDHVVVRGAAAAQDPSEGRAQEREEEVLVGAKQSASEHAVEGVRGDDPAGEDREDRLEAGALQVRHAEDAVPARAAAGEARPEADEEPPREHPRELPRG